MYQHQLSTQPADDVRREGASAEGVSFDGRKVSWWLSTDLRSVRRARRLARETLVEWGFDDQVEVAELLVSELVGNALDHARGQVGLSFSADDGLLRCVVEDEDPELPCMRTVDEDAESGRGLFLVDMLSNRWGAVPTAQGGKAIWFELPAFADAEVEMLDALAVAA
ncbi:anti-sigma regulatory factor (Ser/Thr protein kinase) [Nonomuraea polychroma]|uniref:Anti-sigma regulatory factor (Ser/Thr protein kinase) n=1 Tax=Nonomuraea polychroma TaxID=46176 RepID=A0A438MG92_9ACTN|nr:ATP-binding protein [Nonomuraea polychroma]RVX44860.1 anti-sigma regulatory factor (Ser/Thr protein kinase) [Nonomuraea polychroma]